MTHVVIRAVTCGAASSSPLAFPDVRNLLSSRSAAAVRPPGERRRAAAAGRLRGRLGEETGQAFRRRHPKPTSVKGAFPSRVPTFRPEVFLSRFSSSCRGSRQRSRLRESGRRKHGGSLREPGDWR